MTQCQCDIMALDCGTYAADSGPIYIQGMLQWAQEALLELIAGYVWFITCKYNSHPGNAATSHVNCRPHTCTGQTLAS